MYAVITLNSGKTIATATVAKLNKWYFNPKSQQLEICLSSATTPEYFYLNQAPRLVVDLPNTQLGNVDTQKTILEPSKEFAFPNIALTLPT